MSILQNNQVFLRNILSDMKKLYSLIILFFLIAGNMLFAQLLLPQFNPVEKQMTFSSDEEDSSPIPFNEGRAIYYNRTYTEIDGENTIVTGQEVWFAEQGKKGWKKPYRLLREDDLPGENLVVGTNKTGTRIYVFNAFADKDTLYRRLYYLDKAEEKYKWSAPTEVIIPGLVFGNDFIHFYVNPEETAILVSKPPQGKRNNEDIFVSVKDEKGNWSKVIDLGKTINTNRFELGSFITNDLKTIYFSSEGHGGYGASDVFVSMRLDDSWQNWTNPLNLGEPINSIDYDAFFIMANGNEVYFTSDRGDLHSNFYKGTITGEVILANTDSLKGVFIHKGKAVKGITFSVTDSKGNKVADVTTDEKGVFKFEKLKGEENYLVKMKEEDSDFVGSKIYFLNESDLKTDRYVLTEEGIFVNAKDLASNETVKGTFNYNSLPALGRGLVVLDENGFPLDTIYTDDKGNFTYSVLHMEGGFSIIPLNMTEDEFVNVEMYLTDVRGNRRQTLKPAEFYSLKEEDDTLVENSTLANDRPAGIDVEDNSDNNVETSAINNAAGDGSIIYFAFGEKEASQEELNKLTLIVSMLKLNKSKTIMLIGHTDDTGEGNINMELGAARGGSIRVALMERGVPADKINILSRGELKPAETNDTSAGRAKNRRVQMILQ